MKRSKLFILSLLSSILLSLPWYQQFSGIIIIVAFIPLLFIEDYIYNTQNQNKPIVIIGYAALTFALWNILTTYWVKNAAFIAIVAGVAVNTFLMTMVFWLFHFTKRKLGPKIGNFSFLIYWIGFEYLYLNTEISWPWLNLGNSLAKDVALIQWYEYTGTLGGTLWIIVLNLFLFTIINSYINTKNLKILIPKFTVYLLSILIPIIISLTLFKNYQEKGKAYNIAILQPNIDPYNEKYGGLSHKQQLNIIMDLADSITDENTDYVIGPETALDNYLWEDKLDQNYSIQVIKKFVSNRPRVNFVIGMDSYKRFMPGEKQSETARYYKRQGFYYDVHNAAVQIDTSTFIPVYCKSKLVTGIEKMPFPKLFKLLENVILDFGGTTGSRGSQNYRENFKHTSDDIRIAPVICYESIYGEYLTDYVKKGANLIFVITNDGWWGDTPGYKQHLSYSQLRAIETRHSVARSANTGISAFINQKGEIISKTEWWKKDAIKNTLKANNKLTFYVKYGDYIGRISGFISILLILYSLVQHLLNKSINKKKLKNKCVIINN